MTFGELDRRRDAEVDDERARLAVAHDVRHLVDGQVPVDRREPEPGPAARRPDLDELGAVPATSATASPASKPRARSARTSWSARSSSWAKVRSPNDETMAGRSGTTRAQYEIARPSAVQRAWSSGSTGRKGGGFDLGRGGAGGGVGAPGGLWFGAGFGFFVGGARGVSYELTRNYLVTRRQQTVRQQAYLNARAVRDALEANPVDVRGALAQAQTGADSAVVLRVGNQWFGTSVGVGRTDVPQSLRELVAGGSAGTQNTKLSSTPSIGVGVPLLAIKGSYFEFVPVRELDQTLSLLARALTAAAIVITGIGAVLGRYASGRVLRPVRRMAATAAGISEGALDQRLDAEGDSDLEPLVDAFNAMVSALKSRIDRETRFASDVSHELRTPLATMAAALNVARRRRGSAETAESALAVLDDEVQRFTRLVLDLLEISRLEAGATELAFSTVGPEDLVRQVLASSQREGR